ncbi:MAG: hypothetical protein LBV02_02680, partial [Bacteroidales bacterium]|nr:hypothetical protein [Bacteroidales bacterium]
MNVNRNKGRWKFILYLSAFIVFIVIIYYSNLLITNIGKEERRRVQIWADAISYKAELVNYTEKFFERIRIEEGRRASIYTQAIMKINEASLEEDITFYTSIIEFNSTIPSIIVNEKTGRIDVAVNVDPEIAKTRYIQEVENYQ